MEINISMPGYRIHEYRLVLPLPEALQEKVLAVRKNLHEKYKVKLPFELKPSLSLLKCSVYEQSEQRLLDQLQQIALSTDVFKVELQNFSAFPSHSIYVNVTTKVPFMELSKELKRCKRLMHVHGHDPLFISEPQLQIAQNLKPFQFIRMWLDCEHSAFSGRFMADAFLLLKKSPISNRYEVVRRMEFMNLPAAAKQGTLFS
jgi:2'-5' RNA ligase